MPPETIIELISTSVVTGAVGILLWTRLNQVEARVDELRVDMRAMEDGLRADMGGLRTDIGGLREEMAVMRSDLTHVALAVGANRPKPMEG